ncbi:histidine kinase [Streptomyces sp. Ru73]|uniref:sensor histidine kinase n=1 Tax=Streptomyces sp. Ru73 TaxID=2080748 RepID=UPI000CDD461C|nr:histidine kinase [Streptomyces sp. Ru73]POX42464.1 histidine kinase [Streptomyces sp. Ru73]
MEHREDVRRAVPGRVPRWLLPGEFLAGGDGTPARRTPRDWTADAVTFGVAVLLGLVASGIVQRYDHPPDWQIALDLLLGAPACLSLWWRRRHPLLVALLALPAVAVSSSALPAVFVLTANLALRLPWRRSLLVLGLYVAASLLGTLLLQGFDADGVSGVAFALAYYLTAFACGSTLRARRLWVLAVRREADLERAAHARRLADTRRTEREAIAREMHDVLAHRISLLSVHAGALAYRAEQSAAGRGPGLDGTEISESARVIRDNAHQALGELHDVLRVLRTDDGERTTPQPLLAGLPELVVEAGAAGQTVEFHDGLGTDAQPPRPQLQRTVYRVVQEGLTNARKHAPGAKVTVRLAGRPGSDLTIEIANQVPTGAPAPDIPGTGAGLTGLAERVRLDGGRLSHGTADGTFTLRAALPWAAE